MYRCRCTISICSVQLLQHTEWGQKRFSFNKLLVVLLPLCGFCLHCIEPYFPNPKCILIVCFALFASVMLAITIFFGSFSCLNTDCELANIRNQPLDCWNNSNGNSNCNTFRLCSFHCLVRHIKIQ